MTIVMLIRWLKTIWGLGPLVQIGEEVFVLEGDVSNAPCNPGGRGGGDLSNLCSLREEALDVLLASPHPITPQLPE